MKGAFPMHRHRLAVRLLRPAGLGRAEHVTRAFYDLVPSLVCHLRSADGHGEWHFGRPAPPDPATLDLWFRSRPAVIAELADRLRRRCAELGWPLESRDAPLLPAEAPLPTALSVLSSDLALDLLATGPHEDDRFGVAALHLRLLIELVPPAARPAFLFQCWQQWSRELPPATRVALGEEAEAAAVTVLDSTAEAALDHPYRGLWARYLRDLHAVWQAHGTGGEPPRPYELFEHARLTHDRLGVPAETAATAAKALRSALGAGSATPGLSALLAAAETGAAAA
ncbi:MAG TPA: hypothetical protein VHJ17_02965 [Thermomonospora sp.]|nr:hypothetical protein [Thermomonospora sp.]